MPRRLRATWRGAVATSGPRLPKSKADLRFALAIKLFLAHGYYATAFANDFTPFALWEDRIDRERRYLAPAQTLRTSYVRSAERLSILVLLPGLSVYHGDAAAYREIAKEKVNALRNIAAHSFDARLQ
ncbi:hypothetical protein FJZ28_00900 [Candidatus Peregrinibacteria bacterium]|nr:hypothetical protein [Candidatus Peregrinibacteria bacterium]